MEWECECNLHFCWLNKQRKNEYEKRQQIFLLYSSPPAEHKQVGVACVLRNNQGKGFSLKL